jgi:hypothetical protein
MNLKTAVEIAENEQSQYISTIEAIDEFTTLVNCGAMEKPFGFILCN